MTVVALSVLLLSAIAFAFAVYAAVRDAWRSRRDADDAPA
jgi:hypothetical protein